MDMPAKAILRAQVEAELYNKKQCGYESYQCSLLTVDGYKYCIKHILNDKNAPYKQCSFIYQSNGKRCNLPAPKGDKKEYGYCSEHSLKTTLARNKKNSKNPPPLTAESLLSNLSHYIKKPKNRTSSGSTYLPEESLDSGDGKLVRVVDPFVDIDAASVLNEQCNEVLDNCSESESDVEPSTYATVWHDAHADSSDNESIDSEDEDPLKHANVYTAEEITLLTRDKLVRLQSLYIEEYKHLRYLLREKRKKYINSLKREKETCCNIYNQVKDNPKEQRLYKKLKQYNKYQKAYGKEAILEKRLHDLRAKISDVGPVKPSSHTKCQFSEGGVKCTERTLPMAKHCRKHILEDPHQVLFKACGKTNANVECSTPVEAIFDDSTCKLHMDIPLIRSYSQPRTSQGSKYKGKESESDPDDSLDLPPYSLSTNDNVKTEMIDYSLQTLPKMEVLPSMLFEDSAESLSSTLQYSTSEFTESFAEQNSMETPDTSACHIEFKVTAMEPESEADELRPEFSTTKRDDSFVNNEPFQPDDPKEEVLIEQLETGLTHSGECVIEEMQVDAEEFHIEELSSVDSDSQPEIVENDVKLTIEASSLDSDGASQPEMVETEVNMTAEVSSVDSDSESQPEMVETDVNLTAEVKSVDSDDASQPEVVGPDVQFTTEVSSADSDSISQPEDFKLSDDQSCQSNEEKMETN